MPCLSWGTRIALSNSRALGRKEVCCAHARLAARTAPISRVGIACFTQPRSVLARSSRVGAESVHKPVKPNSGTLRQSAWRHHPLLCSRPDDAGRLPGSEESPAQAGHALPVITAATGIAGPKAICGRCCTAVPSLTSARPVAQLCRTCRSSSCEKGASSRRIFWPASPPTRRGGYRWRAGQCRA